MSALNWFLCYEYRFSSLQRGAFIARRLQQCAAVLVLTVSGSITLSLLFFHSGPVGPHGFISHAVYSPSTISVSSHTHLIMTRKDERDCAVRGFSEIAFSELRYKNQTLEMNESVTWKSVHFVFPLLKWRNERPLGVSLILGCEKLVSFRDKMASSPRGWWNRDGTHSV